MTKLNAFLTALLLTVSASVFAGPVNINAADAATLDAELTGVGPVIAQRIVEHREAHGPFQAPEMLTSVKGIGEKTVAKNREFILVE